MSGPIRLDKAQLVALVASNLDQARYVPTIAVMQALKIVDESERRVAEHEKELTRAAFSRKSALDQYLDEERGDGGRGDE